MKSSLRDVAFGCALLISLPAAAVEYSQVQINKSALTAQADIARMTRIGNVAVGLYRINQRCHAGDHRGPPAPRRRPLHAATPCTISEKGSSPSSP